MAKKRKLNTKISRKTGRKQQIKKIVSKGRQLAIEALNDPITKEFIEKQKRLAEETIKKVIRRMEKKVKIK